MLLNQIIINHISCHFIYTVLNLNRVFRRREFYYSLMSLISYRKKTHNHTVNLTEYETVLSLTELVKHRPRISRALNM